MRITRPDGLLTVKQAAELAGVDEITVRNWINRGYYLRGQSKRHGHKPVQLPVAKREGRINLLDTIEVAKAEWNTRERARRLTVPTAA